MNRNITTVSACLILLLLGNAATATASIPDVVSAVNQTTYTNYLDNMLYTHLGDNRGVSGTEHDLARDNIYSEFSSFGLTASYNPFQYGV